MVRSDGGMLSCTNRMRNDGTAITTRMTTGMTVQATSSSVLWVVRDGVGLARALNFTITMSSSTSTKTVMADDDPEHEIVEPDDVVHRRRRRLLEAHLPRRRLAEAGERDAARCECRHESERRGGRSDQSHEHQHWRVRSFQFDRSDTDPKPESASPSARAWHDALPASSARSGIAPRTELCGFSNHNSALLAMRLWK